MGITMVGVVLIAGSAMIWSRQTHGLKQLADTRAVLQDSLGVLQADSRRTNERFLAFQQSFPSMPDSVRRYGGKKLMEVGTGYTKRLRTLATRERDVKLKISGTRLRAEGVKRRAMASALPVGVAGLVVLITGVVVARNAGKRPVGA
jgi:hypothetical protein